MIAKKKKYKNIKEQLALHSMLLPGMILSFTFSILPIIGLIMAFQIFDVSKGFFNSQFVDIYHFTRLFSMPFFRHALANTFIIAAWKIVLITVSSIILALLVNELHRRRVKTVVQTIIFLPYFLSWALLGGIIIEMFSLNGIINHVTGIFGAQPTYFITSNDWFRTIVVGTDIWKNVGYQIVVFLAAIVNIDPALYEAAKVDGANNWHLCKHITLPGISTMIVLVSILNIGNIMNAGFEQILVMYNPSVYESGDILDTFAYRLGLGMGEGMTADYSKGAAIGLFKSAIGCTFFSVTYFIANKTKGYRIF